MAKKGYRLGQHELKRLRAEHRITRDKRLADRRKAVVLLGSGWSAKQVAEALLIDPDTTRGYFKRYRRGEIGNTGRDRLNINGAIELERLEPVVRFDDTINAAPTIALFEQLEATNPASTTI